jgi:hypothetical protein
MVPNIRPTSPPTNAPITTITMMLAETKGLAYDANPFS